MIYPFMVVFRSSACFSGITPSPDRIEAAVEVSGPMDFG
jgi:hypothetical protein